MLSLSSKHQYYIIIAFNHTSLYHVTAFHLWYINYTITEKINKTYLIKVNFLDPNLFVTTKKIYEKIDDFGFDIAQCPLEDYTVLLAKYWVNLFHSIFAFLELVTILRIYLCNSHNR